MAIRIWVDHSSHPAIDICNYEGIRCVICGISADDPCPDTWDSEDARSDEEDQDMDEWLEVCVAHLNPTCSEGCRVVLDAKQNPVLAVGDGL